MLERMIGGELYQAGDPEVVASAARAAAVQERYNATLHDEDELRSELLREMFGSVGSGVIVRPRIEIDHGSGVSIGDGSFINCGAVMLDGAPVTIGSTCWIASNVQLITATHPIDPEPRRAGWEYCLPVTLADNVWLGAGVIVCPGVSIGADTVVGAGAVVAKDLPAGVVAAGTPARVLREIGPGDRVEPSRLPPGVSP